uniref:Uncharacterized protein n=3 Tax=viral metagenome TaxID=1070528 RepID=A0A6H2A155_9ZZZZ
MACKELEDRAYNVLGGRMRDYKLDSTKGKSLVHDPQTYKRDALVQAWIDSRDLATLSEFLDLNGLNTRFLSEVLQHSLRILTDMLKSSGEANYIEDMDIARDMLFRKYRVNLNPTNRGLKNAHHNRILKNRKVKEFIKEGSSYTAPKHMMSEEEARAKYSHYEPSAPIPVQSELSEEAKKRVVDALAHNIVEPVSESKTDTNVNAENIKTKRSNKKDDRPRAMTREELNDKAIAFEKKQRDQLLALKNMPAASKIFKQNV